MARKALVEKSIELVKKEKEEDNGNGNGLIPVLCDSVCVWYDVKDKKYIAVAKIEEIKHKFEEICD